MRPNPPSSKAINRSGATYVGVPAIMSDNQLGGRIATEHLLGLGHRRFGYLMPPPRNVDASSRLAGVRAALVRPAVPEPVRRSAYHDDPDSSHRIRA